MRTPEQIQCDIDAINREFAGLRASSQTVIRQMVPASVKVAFQDEVEKIAKNVCEHTLRKMMVV